MRKSPFLSSKEVIKGREFTEKEYITYKLVESVGEGYDPAHPEEFTIKSRVVEDERVPIREELNSYKSKVGLKNLLKGISSRKQLDDFISKTSAEPGYADLTRMPATGLEVKALSERVDEIWKSIPEELRGSLTKEEFLRSLSSEKIKSYVMNQAEKKNNVKETKTKEGDEK